MMSVEPIVSVIFWLCLAGLVYAYAVYPLLIWCLARFVRRTTPADVADDELPTVSLLIAAFNEEAVIEKRLQSALLMDYPRERLEIVVASDGSSDRTAEIIRRFSSHGVKLLHYKERRGKATVLNASFPELGGDLVLLSDANTQIDPSAIRKMVRWFRDENMGVVCGRLILTDAQSGRNVDGMYWRYETFLKQCEARLGALLGANGAIYMIRRDLFEPIPAETIIDDFVIPLSAKLRTDCRIAYECAARAWEETSASMIGEFHRRARIGAGGFQCIGWLWKLLSPRRGWISFTFFSHKVLRWCGPFLLILLLISNLYLCADPMYRRAMFLQLGFYGLAAGLAFVPIRPKLLRPLRLMPMFTGMNLALFVGFWRWIKGSQKAAWKRTERLVEAEADVAVQ
jgi:cellulose synthase/poly-beta-1,6-N-acetylglucosamine synthase-like glycosyltransferase